MLTISPQNYNLNYGAFMVYLQRLSWGGGGGGLYARGRGD